MKLAGRFTYGFDRVALLPASCPGLLHSLGGRVYAGRGSMSTSYSIPPCTQSHLHQARATPPQQRVPSHTNKRKFACVAQATQAAEIDSDWRQKAKPIRQGGTYPAKEFCSHCGLCDTYYIAHVKDACAFLGSGKTCAIDTGSGHGRNLLAQQRLTSRTAGMSKIEELEGQVHGRQRCEPAGLDTWTGAVSLAPDSSETLFL